MLDCGKRCGTLQKLPRTVFLPVNVAWNKYFSATGTTLADLTSKKSRKALTALMRYHVLPQVVPSSRVPLSSDVPSSSTGGGSSSSGSGSSSSSVAGEEVETLQGGSITLARRPDTSTIRVAGSRNQAVVLHADISLGTPLVHLVSDVLLLEVTEPPPAELPAPMPSPSPPPPSPSRSPTPSPSPGSGAGSSPKPLSRPGTPATGSTIFNLTWDRNVDMDLIVVASWPETDSGDTMTMFYGYTGPEALIGGGAMSASMAPGGGALTGFYSRTAGSWEALSWPNPLKPAPAVYTICSFFYNLEWAPGTAVSADAPVNPAFTVITGADQNAGAGRGTAGSSSTTTTTTAAGGGEVLVGTLGKPLWKPGEFSFTLLPRNCTPDCPWYLGQVCVDGAGKVRVVSGAERC
ncbi:hypothetical protein HYH02_015302 [Chlamydomonas schloesseri]|uniref:FAS1 domain-containing protein n=1 Tax=Chlamydomonas schloesseri TaxID=2026947 RepID=A0A835SF34_9CHLO|nr:hypothetical protein HYH02_015302 [Chlamydomonas schloesseri]|eukprot:KAG2423602.1 hypothetical protein HYH02_015302 [Chlamydomonas schloesseri]